MLFSIVIFLLLTSEVHSTRIKTANIILEPPTTSKIVKLVFVADPTNTIPQDGSFRLIFPIEASKVPYETEEGCTLEQPPFLVSVKCEYEYRDDGRLQMTASGFDRDLSSFFSLYIPGYLSPRSTAPTDSFEFESFDKNGRILDFQTKGIQARAQNFSDIKQITIKPQSQEVGIKDQQFTFTFVSRDDLKDSDIIQITLPKWNPASSFPDSFFIEPDQLSCEGITNLIPKSVCRIRQSDQYDTITLFDPFNFETETSADQISEIKSGSQISFKVGPVRNPLSTAPVQGIKIETLDQKQGIIQSGTQLLKINEPTRLSASAQQLSLSVSETLITEQAFFTIDAILPVPLNQGCNIDLSIPKQLPIGPEMNTVLIKGMFGKQRETVITIDAERNVIKIQNACNRYRENIAPATFEIRSLTNPGYVFSPDQFLVDFLDKDGNRIVSTSDGPTYQTTPGQIRVLDWYASNMLISSPSEITFSISPEHPSLSSDTQIEVFFPKDDFEKLPQPCKLGYFSSLVDETTLICDTKNETHSLTISNVLKEPYREEKSSFIVFGILDIEMPSSSRPTGEFRVQFKDKIGDEYFLVDETNVSDMVRAEPGDIRQTNVTPTQNLTFTEDEIDIEFKVDHKILQNGSIEIKIPKEMYFTENADCLSLPENFDQQAFCTVNSDRDTLIVKDAFKSSPYTDLAKPIQIKLEGIFTPRSALWTSTFSIKTLDQGNYEIETDSSFFLPPMIVDKQITEAQSLAENVIVGGIGYFDIVFKSPYPTLEGDVLFIEIPKQADLPLSSTYVSCQGSPLQKAISNDLQCELVALNGLKIQIGLTNGLLEVVEGTEMGVRIYSLKNPASTEASSPFNIEISDSYANKVVQITDNDEFLNKLEMNPVIPANLLWSSIKNDPPFAFKETLISFSIITNHKLPSESQIQIDMPDQITLSAELSCWVSTAPDSKRLCIFDEETGQIKISNINQNDVVGGSMITIEIGGFSNSKFAALTDTFTLLTLSKNGFMVDQNLQELQLTANCNYPCLQCSENPSECRICDTSSTSLFPFYHNGSCLASCPAGFYSLNNICSRCDPECLECADSAKKCTKCHPERYLLGNACFDQCPLTHHGSDETGLCEVCEKPCETCLGSRSHCLSCDQTLPQYLFFQNKCYENCPADVSVFDQGQCVECSTNCKTCADTFDSCSSCHDELFLDIRTLKCFEECPKEISVANTILSTDANPVKQERVCELCHDMCAKCDPFDSDICSECAEGLKMIETTKQCYTDCPRGTADIYIALTRDSVCVECSLGCSECLYSRDHCTVCKPGFIFHNYQCVEQCPDGFKTVQDSTAEQNDVCVRDGIVCDYGYKVSEITGECELDSVHCQEGYTLNEKLKQCIPEPGFHLPFAFLYAAAGWLVYVLRPKNRNKFSKQTLLTQVVTGLVCINQLGYFVLLILAYHMGYDQVTSFHTAAMAVNVILNIAWVTLASYVIQDRTFKHWQDDFQNHSKAILAFGAIYSFKVNRLFYAKFEQKPYFSATYEEQFRSVVRPIFIFSMLGLLQVGPITLVNAYSIWMLRWGYELKTLAIESVILSITILVLEIYEFVLYQNMEPKYLGVQDYFTGDPNARTKRHYEKQKRQQLKVMSIIDEEPALPADEFNHSQKQLLPLQDDNVNKVEAILNNKQIVKKQKEVFSNFSMNGGAEPNASNQEVDLGTVAKDEKILQGLVKNLSEHRRLKTITDALEADLKLDDPRVVMENTDDDSKPTIVHAYIDEDYRKKALATSISAKKKIFREKRQVFEDRRRAKSLERQQLAEEDLPNAQQAPSKQLFNGVQLGFQSKKKEILKPMITQVNLKALKERIRGTFDSAEELDSEQDSALILPVGGETIDNRSLSEQGEESCENHKFIDMIGSIQIKEQPDSEHSSERPIQIVAKKHKDNLKILQDATEEELRFDKLDYDQFYEAYQKEFDRKAKRGELVPNARLTQSFDEDVLRELYDDFGVESDFDSADSWISYPPLKGFVGDYYENNPRKQAENELFRQKLKNKFNFCNLYEESYPNQSREKLKSKPAKKTQTFAHDVMSDMNFDPFASEKDYSNDSSDKVSAIESAIPENIFDFVIEHYSGVGSERSDHFSAKIRGSTRLSNSQAFGAFEVSDSVDKKGGLKTRKRKRDVNSDAHLYTKEITQHKQFDRIGLQGRGTQPNNDLNGQLGDVYDTKGHLVYDREYLSRLDQNSEIPEPDLADLDAVSRQDMETNSLQMGKKSSKSRKSSQRDAQKDKSDDDASIDIQVKFGDRQKQSVYGSRKSDKGVQDLRSSQERASVASSSQIPDFEKHNFYTYKHEKSHSRSKSRESIRQRKLKQAYEPISQSRFFEEDLAVQPKVADNKRPVKQKKSRRRKRIEASYDIQHISDIANTNQRVVLPEYSEMTRNQLQQKKSNEGAETSETNRMEAETRYGNMSSALESSQKDNKIRGEQMGFTAGETSNNEAMSAQKPPMPFQGRAWDSENSQFNSTQNRNNTNQGHNSNKALNKTELNDESSLQINKQRISLQNARSNWSDDNSHKIGRSVKNQQSLRTLETNLFQTREPQVPRPFMTLGVTSKPFKAQRKKQQAQQMVADQRRAHVSSGKDRMKNLENIYIKHGLSGLRNTTIQPAGLDQTTSATAVKKNLLTVNSRREFPRADSVTDATQQVFLRHRGGGADSRLRNSAAANYQRSNSHMQKKRSKRLRKQNFVEDGSFIMGIPSRLSQNQANFEQPATISQLSADEGPTTNIQMPSLQNQQFTFTPHHHQGDQGETNYNRPSQ